jgi:hypothetical protein
MIGASSSTERATRMRRPQAQEQARALRERPGRAACSARRHSTSPAATGATALAVLGPVGRGGLGEQLGDLGLEVGDGAVGRRGGVGCDLGAVQGDQPQAHHPGRRAQLQRLNQQPSQGLFVADPKAGDGHVIGVALPASTREAMSSRRH